VELDWMRTFLAVVDRGGFTAAAEQVHRSQSRVSAHIAALERELGVTLVDRTRRPARLTHAGEVFAGHARDILAAVGSARAAVGAARRLDEGRLTLLTTPGLGATYLPAPLGRLAAAHPRARFEVLEDGPRNVERRFREEGVALAVLPLLAAPPPGLRERILWHEPVRAVVPAGHRFAQAGGPVPLAELAREPLVLAGSAGAVPEILDLLARHGVTGTSAATADCPGTVVALVRAGLGVGLLTDVSVGSLDGPAGSALAGDGIVTLPLAGPGPTRRVAAYWFDVLLGTDLGRALHREILAAPPPRGAVAADATGVPLSGSNGRRSGLATRGPALRRS
jgi:DNA-binding transcriptional LysR family regulator